MTTSFRTLALLASVFASVAAVGCATPGATENEASHEAAATSGFRHEVDGKWTVSRGTFVGEGGASTTVAVEDASVVFTLARVPTVEELGTSDEGVSLAATVSFSSAPTVTGGGKRNLVGNANCGPTAIIVGTAFASGVRCTLSANDQRGDHWWTDVDFDRSGEVVMFEVLGNHFPTFDLIHRFAANAK